MGYVTNKVSPDAQAFAARWEATSVAAREWAAASSGRFVGVLPHVVAEFYDDVHALPLDEVFTKYKDLEIINLVEINFQSKFPEPPVKEVR